MALQPSSLQLIGLSGTNGAGKDAVGTLLATDFGYYFMSVTGLLRDEARRRGLPVERSVLRTISAEWRRTSGLGVLVDRGRAAYMSMTESYTGLVLSSLRNPGEADRIHALGGAVIWVDADSRVRYDRIQANASHRDRPEEDNKTYAQFLQEEHDEMYSSSGHAAELDMAAVKTKSDAILLNDYSSIDDLRRAIETQLGLTLVSKT